MLSERRALQPGWPDDKPHIHLARQCDCSSRPDLTGIGLRKPTKMRGQDPDVNLWSGRSLQGCHDLLGGRAVDPYRRRCLQRVLVCLLGRFDDGQVMLERRCIRVDLNIIHFGAICAEELVEGDQTGFPCSDE